MAALSLRAYAKHRGVTLKAVQKAIESGRIHTTTDGKIDPERADAEWARNTGPKVKRSTPAATKAPHAETPRPEPASGGLDYAMARAIIANYEARLVKLDYEERIKKLVKADEVSIAAFNLFRMFRDRLLNMPDRVVGALLAEFREALRVAGINPESVSLEKVHGILMAEVRSFLEEFADAAHR